MLYSSTLQQFTVPQSMKSSKDLFHDETQMKGQVVRPWDHVINKIS